MIDLKPIRVFLTVAEQASFLAAARELGMSAASVTRIVARLEAELGVQLLLRTTRQVALTSEGALIAARYRPLMAEFDTVTEELLRAARPDQGVLRINAPLSLGIQMLPEVIDRFRQAYPGISVQLRLTDRLLDVIAEDCDLAIRVSGPPGDKSTIWRKLCEMRLMAVAAPGLMAQGRIPTEPGMAREEGLYMSYGEGPETWEFHQSGARRSLRAGAQVVSNNGDFLVQMAERGAGVCVLPEFLVARGIAAGRLVQVWPDWQLPSLWLTLFYPPYEKLPPLVASFADFFEAFVTSQGGAQPQGSEKS